MNCSITLILDYSTVKYTFIAVRKHIFRDKTYNVHVLQNCICIGENFHDPNPKYLIEFNLKNVIYWKQVHHVECGFGIKYRNCIKYFEANHENLRQFRKIIACRVPFQPVEEFYLEGEEIGKGSFSKVHKGYKLDDQTIYAIKKLSSKDKKTQKENLHLLENEIQILKSLQNENIPQIFEVYRTDEFNYQLILEYIEGVSLSQIVDSMKKLTCKLKEQEVKVIMQQLLKAMAYLHSKSVIHRDIKPQNIMLVNGDYRYIKIIDFGLSICNQKQHNKCGTPGYMPPEILNQSKEQPCSWETISDMFSVGVVFFKLLSRGVSCFLGQSSEQVMANNKQCNIDYQPVNQFKYSKHAISLLKSLLTKKPEERITAFQALKHPYFADLVPVQLCEINSTVHFSNLQQISLGEIKQTSLINDMDQVSMEVFEKEQTKKVYQLNVKPSRLSRQKTCASTGGTRCISQVFDRYNSLQQNY